MFLSRKGIKLKSGEIVNRSNYWSEDLQWFLYSCAAKVLARFDNPNIHADELVNEAWLKYSRLRPYVQTRGVKKVMYSYLKKKYSERPEEPLYDRDFPVHYEACDCFDELLQRTLLYIDDAETRFILELHLVHGMSYRQIASCFETHWNGTERKLVTSQALEARTKRAIEKVICIDDDYK
jgi:hypothetical protein